MNTEKLKIKNCFNRSAHHYDNHAELQKLTGVHLINLLKQFTKSFAHTLDLGCGTGMITEKLWASLLCRSLTGIDLAEKPLAIAKSRLSSAEISFIQSDFDKLPCSHNSIDFIFSNMALHWSANFSATLHEIYKVLTDQNTLAFSIPVMDTFHELQTVQNHLQQEREFTSFYSLETIKSALRQQKFTVISENVEQFTFYFDNITQLLHSIKKTGTNYCPSPIPNLLTKNYLSQLQSKYSNTFANNDQKLPLTYSIAFIVAQK